jgi:hypothetical protein
MELGLDLDLALRLGSAALGAPANPELITNGTFDVNTTGWTASNTTLSVVGGAMRVENTGALFGFAYQAIACTPGVSYTVTNTFGGNNNASKAVTVASFIGGSTFSSSTGSLTFTASAATMYVHLYAGSNVLGNYNEYDNVSAKRT